MKTGSRVAYGVLSQGVTSLTNFIIVIVIARTQTPEILGAWTLGFAVVTLGTTLGRAALSTPIILSRADDKFRDIRGGLTCTLAGVTLTAVVTVALGLLGLISLPLATALALSAIAALAQDFLRYSWIARGKPSRSLILDLVWLSAQAAATVTVFSLGTNDAATLTLTWGGAAALSTFVGIILDRNARLSLTAALQFYRTYAVDSRRLLGESLANALGANLLPFVVTAVLGYAAAGAFRVGQTFLAPLTTLIAGLTPVILRDISARADRQLSTRRIVALSIAGLEVVTVMYGGVLLLLPASIGEQLAGETWPLVQQLLLPLVIFALIRPSLNVAMLYLRARRQFTLLRTASWVFLVPTLLWSAAFGWLWGIAGIGWGQVFDGTVRASFYGYRALVARDQRPRRNPHADPHPDEEQL